MPQQEPVKKVSRRSFMVRSLLGGTGVLLGTAYLLRNPLRRAVADYVNTAEAPYMGNTSSPMLWFEVRRDNTVTFHCPKVEMGQGTFTGLAQIAADELGVALAQMRVVHASSSVHLDGTATGGSTSISSLWMPLRELAATLREMIKKEASQKLGIPINGLSAKNGILSGGGRSMTYGEAVAGVTAWKIPDTPTLKALNEYEFIGKPIPRIDLREKVMGDTIYGMDVSLSGMLYGSVVRPPSIGAIYLGADTSIAKKMTGVVKVVEEADFVGVVATTRMQAENAKQAIKGQWKIERTWQSADIAEMIKVGKGTAYVIQKKGNAKKALEKGDIFEAQYSSPIGAHAQLEPNGAVAHVEKEKATVILSTQVVGITRKEVAARLGFGEEQVQIVPAFLGGGFGRRLHTPNAVQAAVLSKAVGKPVKCFFDREEEFRNDTFRPPTHHVLKAKLDVNGNITAMEHQVSSGDVMYGSPLVPGLAEPLLGADIGAWRGGMIQYGSIPDLRAVSWRVKLPFATSWWRSLGLLANTFAIECFMDELALQAGKDPVQFRLQHIQDDQRGRRLREVIKAVVKKAGYRDMVVNGRAMGLAASTDANTPVAHVAEVSIENGEIRVHKVCCAIDPGLAINPDQIRAQCEGAIIMGMSAALYEKMDVRDGQLEPTMYGPYKMALMKQSPKEIEVVILQGADAPGAVGEPPLGPIGAAVANAVFRLTGKRLRAMPLEL